MDGEGRKRKMENEEEDEEEKMEKFFALIRSTREVRERMMAGVDKSKEEEKTAAKEEKKAAGVWNPTFRPEDFMEDADQSKGPNATPAVAGPSSKTEDERSGKEEDKGDGLDLNLSL